MRWIALLRLRLRSLFRTNRLDTELDRELSFHLKELTQENLAAGMSRQEAAGAARRTFGNMTHLRELCRDQRRLDSLWAFVKDFNYAVRSLALNPLLTVTTVLLIAMSISLTCSAYVVYDAVLLRTLSVSNPEQLVLVSGYGDRRRFPSVSIYELLSRERDAISNIFGFRSRGGLQTTIRETTLPLRAIGIRGDYFTVLEVRPVIGSVFDPDSREPVVFISYALWQEQFGGARDVVGERITLGEMPLSVTGVGEPDFTSTQPDLQWDLLVSYDVLNQAIGLSPEETVIDALETVVRLKPGVSMEQYAARVRPNWPQMVESTIPGSLSPEDWWRRRGTDFHVQSASRGLAYALVTNPGLSRALTLTLGVSLLIFVASCLTLALLVVARWLKKQQQTAIRLAIGASKWQMLRPHVIESAVIAVLGCACGLFVATWGSAMGRSFLPGNWRVVLSPNVVGIAVGMAALTVFLSVMLAVFLLSRESVRGALQHGNQVARPHVFVRTALLTLQLAISLVLVHSAWIYVEDLTQLGSAEVGFNVEGLSVYLLYGKLPFRDLDDTYLQQLTTEILELPGVESVGFSNVAPLSFLRDLPEAVSTEDGREADSTVVYMSPGFLETLGVPQLSGRSLGWRDRRAVIVTDRLAQQLYPDRSAISGRLRTPRLDEFEVIGVVGDVAYNGPRLGLRRTIFAHYRGLRDPFPSGVGLSIHARSSRSLADLGEDVREVVQRSNAYYLAYMVDAQDLLSRSVEQERMLAIVSGIFGGLIVVFTGIALYAFCAHLLVLRNRELAVRSSLGASPWKVSSALLRELTAVLAAGVTIGVATIWMLQRTVSTFVIESPTLGPENLIPAVTIVVAVVVVASAYPAFRAGRLDLAKVLRAD